MKRVTLRSKDINKELVEYKVEFSKKDQIELIEDEKYKIVFVNKKPAFFYYQEKLLPTLRFLQEKIILKKIIVDSGAIKFVVNGADIMRPGIVSLDEDIIKEEIVVIIDQNHGKPLAIGQSLFSSLEIKTATSGKIIKNIHYVGDELWNKVI